jgi:hypothetical protein
MLTLVWSQLPSTISCRWPGRSQLLKIPYFDRCDGTVIPAKMIVDYLDPWGVVASPKLR